MTDSKTYDEKELFLRIAEGDEQAFANLFELYASKLKGFFIKLTKEETTARDLVQETFLNLWWYRKALVDVARPSSYIFKIASNISIVYFRKQNMDRRLVSALISSEKREPVNESIQRLHLKEIRHQLAKAVAELPVQQRQVFQLSRDEGMSRTEIAQKLGLAEKTVRNHLTLALRFLQDYLHQRNGVYLPLILLVELFQGA